MKALAVFFIFAVVAELGVTSKEINELETVVKKCSADNDINNQEFAEWQDGMQPEGASKKIQCLFKCIMEEFEHLKDGVLNIDAVIKTWSNVSEFKNKLDVLKKALEVCKSEKGEDDCETAFKISMCLGKNAIEKELLEK